MAQMLQSRVQKLVNIISSLLLFWALSWVGFAQTTLIPGDVLVVTINGSNSSIELVPLIDLSKGTTFSINTSNDLESEIIITVSEKIRAGNTIFISDESSSQYSKDGDLSSLSTSNQVTIFQRDGEVSRILFNATWGIDPLNGIANQNITLPILHLGDGINHQYHLKNGASGTSRMIKRMISDPANWKSSANSFSQLRTSFRLLPAPVIVFNQNVSTVMEGDSIPLNVAIYEHDGSRLTVDVVLNEGFSTADTNDIPTFRSYTYNFTGLIGDAVYEIAVPQFDDTFFEDRETAFFELQNLTSGTFGDFVSHATFIMDNEIPDVSITLVFDSNEPKEDYFEIQNNERVYVNIEGWKVQIEEEVFELKDLIDLAPLEQRRISAADFIIVDNDSEKGFEISSTKLVLQDGYSNIISELVYTDNQVVEAELSENQRDELIIDFENPDGIVQNSSSGIEQTVASEEPSIPIKEGWYPISSVVEIGNSNGLFWDEKLASFRDVSEAYEDSLDGIALFIYKSTDEDPSRAELLFQDSLFVPEVFESEDEWTITLSATDQNENGLIDNAEGYNFIQFGGADSITVSNLIFQIEEEIGVDFIHPMIFKQDDYADLLPLQADDILYSEDYFWFKVDSLLDRTQIILDSDYSYGVQDLAVINDEAISNFQITSSSQVGSSILSFNFYDIDALVPISILNPQLDFGQKITTSDSPILGAYANKNWNREINMSYDQETLLRFPLGLINQESGEITLRLEEWNMEGGWRVFIEDVESNEKAELFTGEEFKIEYTLEKLSEESIIERSTVNERYHLLIASPEYEETILDSPEQIQLNQNYPNPFNPATTISFFIPNAVEVKLSVFNVVGQPIAVLEEGTLSAGEHHYEWNASGYPSGMYIYQLEVGNKVMTRKMTLVK